MLINSYAKINLYLEVLGKRPDGYHEIETVFSAISLHDCLKFALTKKPSVKILSNIPELASGENLVCKVTERIFSDFGVSEGVRIELQKNVPLAAGLGGGSSNAAMTILALNRLCGLNLDKAYMENLAAQTGSDVNFFLYGGLAKGTSRGEKLELLEDLQPMELLLVNPGLRVSSREAYESVDYSASAPREKMWFNRLEAGICSRYPEIGKVISRLKELGSDRAMMSGSGSTCIGKFDDKGKLDKAVSFFSRMNYWVKPVTTLGRRQYHECTQSLSL